MASRISWTLPQYGESKPVGLSRTDDTRESPALAIVSALQARGARVQAYDPEAMDAARKELPELMLCSLGEFFLASVGEPGFLNHDRLTGAAREVGSTLMDPRDGGGRTGVRIIEHRVNIGR